MERPAPFYFISGGCRSGKSSFALSLGEQLAPSGLFVATATAFDADMQARIDAHQAERSSFWQLHEVPFGQGQAFAHNVGRIVSERLAPGHVLLLDCMTLWVSNCMEQISSAGTMRQLVKIFVENIYLLPNPVIIVSNEVGLGLVPDTQSGRQFRDFVGIANQEAARKAQHAAFVVSGLPLVLKGNLPANFAETLQVGIGDS